MMKPNIREFMEYYAKVGQCNSPITEEQYRKLTVLFELAGKSKGILADLEKLEKRSDRISTELKKLEQYKKMLKSEHVIEVKPGPRRNGVS